MTLEKSSIPKWKDQAPDDSCTRPKDTKVEQKRDLEAVVKKQTPVRKPNKPPSSGTGPRMPRPTLQNKVKNDTKDQQKPVKGMIQKKPTPPQQDVSIVSTDILVFGLKALFLSNCYNFTSTEVEGQQ